jgi:protease-4
MQNRGWLIAISIIVGLLLSCAVLPLGGMALLLAAGGGAGATATSATRWQEEIVSGTGPDRVAIIEVSGVIGVTDADLGFSSQLSQRQLLSQIRQATEDSQVKAVVLRVNSPGGGVVASNELHGELKELREAGKHLVVSMGDTAASGGYYIATAGERIYANADTLTGSLGVIVSLLNYEEGLDKLGLRQFVYKSGEFKDIGSPAREPTEGDEQIFQALVDQAYQGFVDVIAEGRNLPREEVLRIADGRIYTGKQALDLKLIDELGGLDEAIEGAKSLAGLQDALVVRYRSADSLRDILVGAATQSRQQADPLGLRAITEPQAPKLEYRLVP